MLNAGGLPYEIELQRMIEAIGPTGIVTQDWQLLRVARANIYDRTTEEVYFDKGARGQRNRLTFVVRWHPISVEIKDRALLENQAYRISEIAEIGKKRWLKLSGEAI